MKYRTVTRKEYTPPAIGKWMEPAGYDLCVCDIQIHALCLSFHLCFGNLDEFWRYAKEHSGLDRDDGVYEALCAFIENPDGGENIRYILITENNWAAEDYGTICHELHHAIHFALNDKGVKYGDAGEEIYAYLQGHLMELVVRAFLELKRAKRTHK